MTKIPSSILKQAIRAVHLFSKGAAAAKERANHGDMIFLKNHRSAEKRWISSLPVSTSINESIYTHTRRRNRQRNKSFLFFCCLSLLVSLFDHLKWGYCSLSNKKISKSRPSFTTGAQRPKSDKRIFFKDAKYTKGDEYLKKFFFFSNRKLRT